jgi:hypothetical protein
VNDDLSMDGLDELDELPGDGDPTAALLRTVLHREADAVTPSPDGYARIRAEIERNRPSRAARAGRRLAPLLAAAAAVAVVATAGTVAVRSITHQSQGASAGGAGTLRTVDSDVRQTPASALPVYVAARQHERAVLFREFRRSTVRGVDAKVEQAVTFGLTRPPLNPEYHPVVALDPAIRVHAHVTDTSITLDLSRAPRLADAPTPQDGAAAVQQLVWTATAAAAVAAPASQQPRTVTITVNGSSPALFGLGRLDRALTRAGNPDPRAPVWIADLAEGQVLRPGRLKVTGDGTNLGQSQVRVVLRYNGDVTVRDVIVPLQRTDPQGTPIGPVAKGQRGQWSIAGWPVTRPGTYTLVVSGPTAAEPNPTDLTAFPDDTWWDSRTFVVK